MKFLAIPVGLWVLVKSAEAGNVFVAVLAVIGIAISLGIGMSQHKS